MSRRIGSYAALSVALSTSVWSLAGCSSDSSPNADTGHAEIAASDSASAETSAPDTAPPVDSGPMCKGVIEGACGTCGEGACCAEIAACDGDCMGCLRGTADPSLHCETARGYLSVVSCLKASCDAQCSVHSTCNPVTNAGRTNAGAACDLSTDDAYLCHDPPNDAVLCGLCDLTSSSGPFCKPGLHCNEDNKCSPYCCADSDCGASGKCMKDGMPDGVGYCVGADGMSATCDATLPVASGGACYTGKTGM